MILRFKNEGWFSEACSARYKAILCNCCYVTIEAFKTKDYGISWTIQFDSTDINLSIQLSKQLNRYIDPVSTKRYAIETIQDLINNNDMLKNILNECTTK